MDWDTSLGSLERYVEQLQNKIDLVDLALDKIRTQLLLLREQHEKGNKVKAGPATLPQTSSLNPMRSHLKPKEPWAAYEPLLRLQAAKGITHFALTRQADHSAQVTADDSTINLSPALADLLAILKESPRGADAFLGWQPLQHVSQTLGLDQHAIRQRITRLRTLFYLNKLNPFYIETCGRGNDAKVRLRWRRADASSPVTAGSAL